MRSSRRVLFVVALALAGASLALAAKRERQIDQIWVRPDAGSLPITSIAMLPAVSYENVPTAERHAEAELMKSIRGSGYRWITAPTAKEMLRRNPGGDSLLKRIREMVLQNARIDSAAAAGLCAQLRVDGLIAVRVERAEQLSIQTDQSGKPSTTVAVHASLVDNVGRRVWEVSGANTLDGPYLQAAPTGSSTMNLQLGNSSTQTKSNAPDWPLALEPLYLRLAPTFPQRASAVPAAPSGDTLRDSTKAH